MNKFAIVGALVVGLGAICGVYVFRSERLTAVTQEDIEAATSRINSIEQQAAANKQYSAAQTADPAASAEDDPAARRRELAKQALAKAEEMKNKKVDPNYAALKIDELPPKVTIIPLESMPEKTPGVFSVLFETTKGEFALECHRDWAPNGADRLYELVRNKYFTDMRVFRAVKDFVVQFGIPGDPAVSAQWLNKNIADDPVTQSNTEGMFTFAASGAPNSRSTQVFINLRDNTKLDTMGFAPVGKIIFGMNVVKSLHNGYGDTISNLQEEIATQGNAFLDKNFPELDSIKRAVFIADITDVDAQVKAQREKLNQALVAMSEGKSAAGSSSVVSERAPDTFKVKLECTMGDVVVECYRDWAPLGADRFYTLVKNGFYNNAKFFRVVPGFITQFGLPADQDVYRDWVRGSFADDPVKQKNLEGTICFAMAGRNTRTTQVFFNLNDNSGSLDPQGFSPFGKVLEGMENVKKINPEYGETPSQQELRMKGNDYLNLNFPRLDGIKSATLIP